MTSGREALTSARKIADLRARVRRVRELLPADVDTFIAQRTEAEALILNLDLALHLVADRGLGVPADARSAFEQLARAGLLKLELAQ